MEEVVVRYLSLHEIEEILRGCEGVTPGPWVSEGELDNMEGIGVIASNEVGTISNPSRGLITYAAGFSGAVVNAAHIARLDPATVKAMAIELLAAREALAARIVPEGWKAVPVKPTPEMLQAACDATYGPEPFTPEDYHRMGYKAMLAVLAVPSDQSRVERLETENEAMRRDWSKFCADIGMEVDSHDAIAEKIQALGGRS